MRKFLISLAIASASIAMVPDAAEAQNRYGWQRGGPTRGQVNELLRDLGRAENQIARAQQRRRISPREAVGLRRNAQQIRHRLNRAARNGINQREFVNLRTQVNRLEQRVRIERNDRDGRRW